MQLYLFPLLIEQQDSRVTLIFRNALILSLAHPGFTFVLNLLLAGVTVLSAVLTGPILFILFSFLASAQTKALQELPKQQPGWSSEKW